MIKKTKLLGALLIAGCAFGLASCGNSKADNQPVVNSTDNINEKVETQQKYVIELNLENYKKYIDVRSNGGSVYFIGTLSYAFYDNVVITSERVYSGTTTTEIELSAGGYASWYTAGYGTYNVTAVKGKVIYWI